MSEVQKEEFEKAIAALEKYLQLVPNASDWAEVEADIQHMRDILAKGPCCEPLQPGKGAIWFTNYIGEPLHVDMSPYVYEVPAKQGDVDGCLCPQLDPGHYTLVIQVGGGEGHWEVDIVAGQIWPFSLEYRDY